MQFQKPFRVKGFFFVPSNFMDDLYKRNLLKLAYAKMPYGKYEGRFLGDLPEYYVIWLKNNRLPTSTLGNQILEVYELKVNGMEGILRDLRQRYPKP